MRKYRPPVIDIIRPFFGAIVGIAIAVSVLGFRLGTVGPGVSQAEMAVLQTVQHSSLSAREILLEDPLYLPYKAGIYGLEKLGLTSLTAIRSIGAGFAVVATISMYLVLKHWHTRRIAIMGSLLFLTSSWLLHSFRLAIPEVCYVLLPLLIFLGAKLEEGRRPFITTSVAMFVCAALLYVPGLVWFILPAAIWQRKKIVERLSEVNKIASATVILLSLALLMPLVYGLATNYSLWQLWLGYNGSVSSLGELWKSVLSLPLTIFIQAETNPLIRVGRLPLLDIATSAFVLLGVYWYTFQRKLDRTKLLAGCLLLSTILIIVNGTMMMALLLPFMYLLAAAGVTLVLQQWFTVFPRNPLARGVAIGLVSLVIGLIGFYHLNRYFIAWPNAPATREVFTPQT